MRYSKVITLGLTLSTSVLARNQLLAKIKASGAVITPVDDISTGANCHYDDYGNYSCSNEDGTSAYNIYVGENGSISSMD